MLVGRSHVFGSTNIVISDLTMESALKQDDFKRWLDVLPVEGDHC